MDAQDQRIGGSGGLSTLLGGVEIPVSASGVLVVDLGAILRNYLNLRGRASPAECAAVVKADGYGVGARKVAQALAGHGCGTFFVATLSEAETLRALLPGVTIYVLDGLLPGSGRDFKALNARPVLGGMAEIEDWSAFCRAENVRLSAAIHIDTGMNRLGLKADEQRRLLADQSVLDGFGVSMLMSHLACADTPDDPKNAAQREAFLRFCAGLPPAPLSLANSAGTFLGPNFHFDLTRPGIGLYGGNPFSSRPNPMEPVIRLYGRILQIENANAGETVGYGASLQLTRPTRYVTVSVGYADGYLRALGSSDQHRGAIAHIDGHGPHRLRHYRRAGGAPNTRRLRRADRPKFYRRRRWGGSRDPGL
jgi:alanine racemase